VNIKVETHPTTSRAQTPFEAEIAALIVTSLHLEIGADEIDPESALFTDGLGLDSIDALELALAISRDYGLELKSDDERNRSIFANLRSLARHVEQSRTK
jgi:acyl carrier protein